MNGAVSPLPHQPSWHAQDIVSFTFTLPLIVVLTSVLVKRFLNERSEEKPISPLLDNVYCWSCVQSLIRIPYFQPLHLRTKSHDEINKNWKHLTVQFQPVQVLNDVESSLNAASSSEIGCGLTCRQTVRSF